MHGTKEKPFNPDIPIIEGDYPVVEGTSANTMLFCVICQLVFYDKPVHDEQSLLELIGAEQVATTHAFLQEHTVYKAFPVRPL